MKTVQHILTNLKSQGFRITQTRKAVLEAFASTQEPLSPLAVQDSLSTGGINVNKTTVYRELDFLLARNIIQKVPINHTSDLYEFSHLPHHHHVICTDCGTVEDVTFDNENSIISEIQGKTTLQIRDHALEFYGLCPQCL